MECRISDLRYKEVINVCTGQRLGFVSDALVDSSCGRILALVVPGPCRFFGLLGREDDYILPWESISLFGEDIILIRDEKCVRRSRRNNRR